VNRSGLLLVIPARAGIQLLGVGKIENGMQACAGMTS
jgi:hypothetical protein